jgi:hypothetical protein
LGDLGIDEHLRNRLRECGMDSSGGLLEHVNEFSYTIHGGEIFDSIATVSFLVNALLDEVSYILYSYGYLCRPVFTCALLFQSLLFFTLLSHIRYDQF